MYRNQPDQSWRNQQNWERNQDQNYDQYRQRRQAPQNYRGENRYEDRYAGRYEDRNNYRPGNRHDYYNEYRYSNPSHFRSDQDDYNDFDRRHRWDRVDYGSESSPGGSWQNAGSFGSYGASRNYGSMGSYGGAQGYGSARNGYSSNKWGSGHQGASFQPQHTVYGAYRDKNSFAEGENVRYDGSQRYGSQGAGNTPQNRRQSRYEQYTGRSTNNQNDDRYEIYDSALSQYNRGAYGNPSGGSFSDSFNLRSHQDLTTRHNYGSRQRGRNRQGSGSDQEYGGTSDLGYNSVGESFNRRQPSYVSAPQNLYFDDLSGEIRNRDWERF
jgi:hypothetical protein